jgi:ribose transport system permease protein
MAERLDEHVVGVSNDDDPRLQRDHDVSTRLSTALSGMWARPVSAVIGAFLLLVLTFSVINPDVFPTMANTRNLSLDASVTLILAVGAAFVVISGNLDLSVGSVLVFCGVVAAKVMLAVGGNGWSTTLIGLVVALTCGGAWGLVNGFLVTKARLNSIIVTLGTMGSALGLAFVITDAIDVADVPVVMTDFGNGRTVGVPNLAVVALATTILFGLLLGRTRFGRRTYAIGSNEQAARRAAIPVERHLMLVFCMSGVLAGLAGWLSLARFSTTAMSGHGLDNFNALTGVLLGGVSLFGGAGAMLGVAFGTLIPVVLANGLVISGLQSYWQQVTTGGVLVAAVYLDRLRRERDSGGSL